MDLTKPGPLPDFARELASEVDRRVAHALDKLTRRTDAVASSVEELAATVRGLEKAEAQAVADHVERHHEIDARLSALEKPKPAPHRIVPRGGSPTPKPATKPPAKPSPAKARPRKIAAKPKATSRKGGGEK